MKKEKKQIQIEWKIQRWKVKDLKDFEHNPRTIGKKDYELLKKNIKKFGLIDRPFINTDGTIIGGHVRTRVLQDLGYEEIEVLVAPVTLSFEEVKELCVKHNKLSGDWDFDMLANSYDILELTQWGFKEEELCDDKPQRKRRMRPKFIIEFTDAGSLKDFDDNNRKAVEVLLMNVNAKIKLLGQDYDD